MTDIEHGSCWNQMRAEAWDEGFDAGEQDTVRHYMSDDWDSPCIKNPYREESK